MDRLMLSTVDNPYNPFTEFDEWYTWDITAGYRSLELLGRIIYTSSDLTEIEQTAALNAAIKEIIDENVLGVSIAVTPTTVPRARLAS